jgi:hypothetical protein
MLHIERRYWEPILPPRGQPVNDVVFITGHASGINPCRAENSAIHSARTGGIKVQSSSPNPDPKFHTERIEQMLDELIQHLRDDTSHIAEPKAQALFETSAEVLKGLKTAFHHYERGSEPAMRS